MWVGAKSYKKELEQFVEECVHRTATSFDAVCPSGGSVCAVLLSSTGRELDLGKKLDVERLIAFLDECDDDEKVVIVNTKKPPAYFSFRFDRAKDRALRERRSVLDERRKLVGNGSKSRVEQSSLCDLWRSLRPKDAKLIDMHDLVLAVENGHYSVKEISLPTAKWSELDRYHSSLFEGGVEHKSLCASVACWFQDSGWGWTTVVPYASGRGDVATTKRNPRINAECGNLTMGIWKLTTAVDAGQAVLYVPFNNEARGWLLEPTEETHQNSALRLWREHCAATRDPW